jgi:superfamily II RNA helicase
LLFKALDLPYADEIAKRLAKMLPPQVQEQTQVPPEVQQQMQAMGQQMEQLQAQLSSAAAQLGDKRMEYEGKRADLMIKERELAIRGYDAETKRIQAVNAGLTPEALRALVINTMNEVAAKPAPLGSESPVPPMVVPEIEAVEPPEATEPPESMNDESTPSGGLSPREEPNG